MTKKERRRRNLRRRLIVYGALLAVLGCGAAWMTVMPGRSHRGDLPPITPEQRALAGDLERHVTRLAADIGERSVRVTGSLDAAADYVREVLRDAGLETRDQEFGHAGVTFRNVEGSQPAERAADPLVVVGAHYDSVDGCPGANDNGSGVAALLELARALGRTGSRARLRFVAFANEEPPFFQGAGMGSLVYARSLAAAEARVEAMLSLETIGCYDDAPGSQSYPFPLSLFYPDRGDFIAFVGNVGSRSLVRRCVGTFREHARFPSEGCAAPGSIPGVGWSDHWSFWKSGYAAVMITDTAPFRYPHYHRPTDTADRIDYERTARVVEGVARVITELAR